MELDPTAIPDIYWCFECEHYFKRDHSIDITRILSDKTHHTINLTPSGEVHQPQTWDEYREELHKRLRGHGGTVYAGALNALAERHEGSNPSAPTNTLGEVTYHAE